MNRGHKHAPNEFYHIYSRGVEKRPVFLSDRDRKRFQKMLYIFNSENQIKYRDVAKIPLSKIDRGERLVNIGAYVEMDNHFHLLISENSPGGISKFMLKLLTSYSKYFNTINKRTGRLFESEYKSRWCDSDPYLKYLFCYIPLNPLKNIFPEWKNKGVNDIAHAKHFLHHYTFSIYPDHSGIEREEGLILNPEAFPEYFPKTKSFDDFIEEWMLFAKTDIIQ